MRFRFTPSASSTSALPDLLDTERPPCFATFAPAAAATSAEAVEMLKVWAASPPVPQVSTSMIAVRHGHLGGELAHHVGGGGDLADGLLLHPQADENAGDLRGRHLAAHDLAHQREHLVVEDLAAVDEAVQGFLGCHGVFTAQASRNWRAVRGRAR